MSFFNDNVLRRTSASRSWRLSTGASKSPDGRVSALHFITLGENDRDVYLLPGGLA
jgi:hypothetical protein